MSETFSNNDENLSVSMDGSVGTRLVSNAKLMFIAKALGSAIGFITLIIAARGLSKAELGIVLFLHGYMLFFAEVATFQSWQTLIRFGTKDVSNNDPRELTKLIQFSIALDFISALAAFIAATGLFALIVFFATNMPSNGGNGLEFDAIHISPYVYIYCVLIFASQQGAAIGIFRLFNKFNVLAARALIMPAVRLAGTLTAFAMHSGIEGYIAAWFLSSLLGKIALPLLAYFELRKRNLAAVVFARWPSLRYKRKGLWAFVWKSNIDSTLAAGITHLPIIIVAPFFGPGYVAVYKIAEEIANLLSRGILLLDQVIYPEFARIIHRGEQANIWKIVVKSGGVLLGGGIALSLLVAMFGPGLVTSAYGAGYEDVVHLSILLVLAAAITGIVAPIYPLFYAFGRPENAIWARLTGLSIYLISFIFFSTRLGYSGPGWAAILGNLFSAALAIWFARTLLKRSLLKQSAEGHK